MMKRVNNNILTAFTVLPALLFFTGCRSTDTDQVVSSAKSGVVHINLIGTDFADLKKDPPIASVTKQNAGIQSQSVLITPSTVITTEMFAQSTTVKDFAQAGVLPIAGVAGNALSGGTKYRVIAYRSNDGAYITYQDYSIGQTGQPITLDYGTSYNIVAYSFGSANLPVLSSGEQSGLSSAVINYDDSNRDFMYQNISYTPVEGSTSLNITLRHKLALITTTVKSNINIGSISNAVLTPHSTGGTIPLSSGGIAGRTTQGNQSLTFSGTFPGVTQSANPVFINADTGGNPTASFSADVTINGVLKSISLPNAFKITPETNSSLNISLSYCGAFVDAGVWKDFMCHDLGADTNANPFTPSAAIQGAKYQWGAQTGETGRYVSQADDQSNSGPISTWIGTSLPAGSWSDTTKTDRDPCPAGYRVPTIAQLSGLLQNNTLTRLGTWADNPTNYSAGVMVGNALFLPAAGRRNGQAGGFSGRGLQANYWGSTERSQITIRETSYNVYQDQVGYLGFSIRCIKE
ncbi:TPA: hypothetical protein ACWX1I_003233 [Elizabethkingia anophelis]